MRGRHRRLANLAAASSSAAARHPPTSGSAPSPNQLDSDHLAKPDRRSPKADVGYVEGPIGTKRHPGWYVENAARAVDQYFLVATWQDADQTSRCGFGAGVARRVRGFQHIHTSAPVEGNTEHLAEPRGNHFDIAARGDLVNALGVEAVGIKPAQIADIEDTVLSDHFRHHVPLRSRDVNYPRYRAGGRDLVQLAVVRLDGIQIPADSDHAVPRSVRLEVAGDRVGWIGDRVRLLERAQVRDHRPAAVRIYADDPVGN